jgi:hypothetical protein
MGAEVVATDITTKFEFFNSRKLALWRLGMKSEAGAVL